MCNTNAVIDNKIKAALKDANSNGRLGVISTVTGIPEVELRQIMDSKCFLRTDHRMILRANI